MGASFEDKLGDAIGEAVKFAQSVEALLAAMREQAMVVETLNRIGTDIAPDLSPELYAAMTYAASVGDALLSAVNVANTKYQLAVERLTESERGDDDAKT